MPRLFADSNYVLAVRASDSAILTSTGVAKPGDLLQVYATGLGSTQTSVPAGLVFSGAYSTEATPIVNIGGQAAKLSYCGLVNTGAYQVNLTVPKALTSGTHTLMVSISVRSHVIRRYYGFRH